MAGELAAIQAISADSAKVATDQGAVVTAQAALTAAQAVVANDSTSVTADDTTLSNLLNNTPGVYVVNPDGTASIYQFSALTPGFTIITVPAAT